MDKPSDEAIEAARQTFGIVIECTGLTDRGIEGGVFIPEAEFLAGCAALAAENERLRQELARWEGWQDAVKATAAQILGVFSAAIASSAARVIASAKLLHR